MVRASTRAQPSGRPALTIGGVAQGWGVVRTGFQQGDSTVLNETVSPGIVHADEQPGDAGQRHNGVRCAPFAPTWSAARTPAVTGLPATRG
jgi:hypothetical protein